ncbi:hypothetical protein [Ideonella livida]|jgi:hypothetical protein|uniref:Uncharacterized protein n=1 Tax=Ideonella livida TaxID=2707176 RepID=A0A7C9TKP6_9BURK|nr:hypothetical protein [Ideonella livida]NDY92881.1 hypothetical protein [Ideonella livida]
MTRPLPAGRHAASVSIRSGHGTASHDRVLRLNLDFRSPRLALRHAAAEGRAWVRSQDLS